MVLLAGMLLPIVLLLIALLPLFTIVMDIIQVFFLATAREFMSQPKAFRASFPGQQD